MVNSKRKSGRRMARARVRTELLEARRLLASIAGTVFNDLDADGVIDAGENGLSGWTVYQDLNSNSVRDTTAHANFASTDVPKAIVDNGTVLSNNLVSGLTGVVADVNVTLNITHTWVGDLVLTLISPTGQQVTLASQTGGPNNSANNYTNTTFDDEAATSINNGAAPYTGTFQPAAPLSGMDNIAPNGTWQLKVDDVFPADGGTINSWTISISTGEPAKTTDSAGAYSFTGLGAGTYRIGQILQAPYQQTSPAGGFHTVTVGAPDNITGRNFGDRLPPGEIRGTKWSDLDSDGVKDAGEPGLSGVTIYVDYDVDGVVDGNEPSAVTIGDGTYAITGVAPGSHIVREVVPAGTTQTFPGPFGAITVPAGKDEGGGGAAQLMGPEPAVAQSDFRSDDLIRPVWSADTPKDVVEQFFGGPSSEPGGSGGFTFSDSNRWSQTATNGAGLTQGQATTLTWNVVADGVSIPGFNGEATAPSNLRSFLDGIYGSQAVWMPLFQTIFDSWSQLTGITYVYENADDGSSFSDIDSASTRGVLGVRADMRIGGHLIDGNSNVLAYNFFPNIGDMVIDTADNWYANNTANNSRGLRNVLGHEHGHGMGLEHVMPVSGTKLMEPFVNLGFDGPQHDDILAANRGYGDRFEKSGANDTTGTGTNLGSLPNTTVTTTNISIDDDSDVDIYRFTVASGKRATITLAPVGSTYLSGVQGGPAPTNFNSKAQSDVALQLIAPNGTTVVASANFNGAGFNELLSSVPLGAGGQYFIKVTGAANAAQLYDLTLTIQDALGGTHSVTVAPSQIVSNINFGNHQNDSTAPTADVVDVSPDPRQSSLASIAINFSEAITGFDKTDLNLTRDGNVISLASATLNSANNINYTLSGLTTLTANAGTYVLTLTAAGSGIIDAASNALAGNASDTWVMNAINGTGSGDTIRIVRQPAGALVDVFINNGTATPNYTMDSAVFPSLQILSANGDDFVTIDHANGSPVPAGGLTVDGGINSTGGDTLAIVGSSGADSVTFNASSVTLGGTTSFAATENIKLDGKLGLDAVTINAGNVTFAETQRLLSLTMATGAAAKLAAGSNRVLYTKQLVMSGTATLDLSDNDMIVDYSGGSSPFGSWNGSGYTGLQGNIASGYNGGAWDGAGIRSSNATAAGGLTGLAIGEASEILGLAPTQTDTWNGQTVNGNCVLVKYTYQGDADMNGELNGDDYFFIDSSVPQSGALFGYHNGDFDYNGVLDGDDYFLIDSNIVPSQGNPL